MFIRLFQGLFLILGAVVLSSAAPAGTAFCAFAGAEGKIINVNPSLEVAYADLNRDELSIGDIVSVLRRGALISYLEVVGTSDAVSKLAPARNGRDAGGRPDFSQILVGDAVRKENTDGHVLSGPVTDKNFKGSVPGPGPAAGAGTSGTVAPARVDSLLDNYVALTGNLREMGEKKELAERELAEAKIKLDVARAELDRTAARNSELEKQLEDKSAALEKLSGAGAALEKDREKLAEQLAEAKGELKKVKALMARKIRSARMPLEARVARELKEKRAALAGLSETRQGSAGLKKALREKEDLLVRSHKANMQLENKIVSLETEVRILKDQLKTRAAAGSGRTLARRALFLENRIADLEKTINDDRREALRARLENDVLRARCQRN
jgi:phage shock protein A